MKKMKLTVALVLAAVLLMSCVSGFAEQGSDQPICYLTQESFLEWFRGYAPEAEFSWTGWIYRPSYLEGSAAVDARLSEDQSKVEGIVLSVDTSTGLTDQQLKVIPEICALVSDTISDESLKAAADFFTQEHSYEDLMALGDNPLSVSDGGKVSLRAVDWGYSLDLGFSEEAAASFTPAAFYDLISQKGGTILHMNVFNNGSTPEGRYKAFCDLHYDGAAQSVTVRYSGDDLEEAKAFLLDAAAKLTGGETLETVKAVITENIEKTQTEKVRVDGNSGPLYYYFNGDSYSVDLLVSVQDGQYPSDAVGFINSQLYEKLPYLE